jgi:hypothetical protein
LVTKALCSGSAVGIATAYVLNDTAIGMLISPYHPEQIWEPASLLSNGYGDLSMVVNRQGREADHSFRTSAEVMKTWIYPFTPPHGSDYLVQHSFLCGHDEIQFPCSFTLMSVTFFYNGLSSKTYISTLKVEVTCSSKTSVSSKRTANHNRDYHNKDIYIFRSLLLK